MTGWMRRGACQRRSFARRLNIERLKDRSLLSVAVDLASRAGLPSASANGDSYIGLPGDGVAGQPKMSGDGRFVVFISNANNLASELEMEFDPYVYNVYRYDRITGDVVLVSINAAGTGGGDKSSIHPVIGEDGNIVAFESTATNLTTDPLFGFSEVFARDISAGTTYGVSVIPGELPSGGSRYASISADGRVVAFQSMSKSLSALDQDPNMDIYARNLETGAIFLVSANPDETASGDGFAHSPQISADGSTVVFTSESSNLHPSDTDTEWDIFARDLLSGTTELVSINCAGTSSGNGYVGGYSICADGSRIAFASSSTDLDPLDTMPETDIFVRDLVAGTTQLVSVNASGTGGANGEHTGDVVISADGNVVAFSSSATNLHPLASGRGWNIFARNLKAGVTRLVSVNSDGTAAGIGTNYYPALGADGNIVAFMSTAGDLHPLDTNDEDDVFVRNLTTGSTQLVSVNSSRSSSGNGESHHPIISSNGEFVAFYSHASDLVVNDGNSRPDVFVGAITSNFPNLPGDYNGNNVVDAADYTLWRDTLGQSVLTPFSGADGDGDGTIDADDYGGVEVAFWRGDTAGSRELGAGSQCREHCWASSPRRIFGQQWHPNTRTRHAVRGASGRATRPGNTWGSPPRRTAIYESSPRRIFDRRDSATWSWFAARCRGYIANVRHCAPR